MILYVIAAAVVGAFATDRMWIRGNGIVAGELTAVSPIVQARLVQLFVQCLDHVTRGQRLAEFLNEATAEAAAQQLLQLELELTQARAAIDIADQEAKAAQKLVEAQAALYKQQVAVLAAETELVKHQNVAVLVWEQAKAAVERADAETLAAEFVHETKKADKRRAELDVDVLQRRIESFQNSPELNGHFYLTAPTNGIVTQCTAQSGEVIAARTAIFSLFNPENTYAVVFFDPSDIPVLTRGQKFKISIGGVDKPVDATLTDFYPELSALPSSLTRYFWQEEKWSQYVPARLDFTDLSETERSKVFAWAQVSASRAESVVSWEWIRRNVAAVWQFATSNYARQLHRP
jgi:multidrug resistance efflux pump